ncbi:MAG: hypothetical protein IJ274_01740, partial [Lachnospiraceae bacterium]|nr:hypothetical protein [Lachnospiraceae bacterium]
MDNEMRKFYTDKQCLKMLYILFAVGLLCAHYFFITGKNDDAWFAEILDKYSLMEYLSMRYELWTSRIFIETAEVF